MTDPLKSRFEAAGREVTPPPGDLGSVQSRGQRDKRRRMLASSGLALIVLSSAMWGISAREGSQPEPPATQPAAFVRLLTEPRGLVEIDASQGEACYRFEMRGATGAHFHPLDSEEVVVELGPNEAGRYGYLGCANGLDPDALSAIAGDPEGHVLEFHNSSSGGTQVATLRRDQGKPSCLRTELTSSEYGVHFDTKEAMAGDEVHVWGSTYRDPDGRYTESDGFELWWNARGPSKLSRIRYETPAIRLASESMEGRCYFQTTFTVPEVPDGTYRITGFMHDSPASEGYGIFGRARFTVGPASQADADCPVTTPTEPAFVPPAPYPSRFPNPNVPDADDRQWYGSGALWTALDSEGEVWQDLPDDDGNGKGFTKTLWWSDAMDERPSPITVRGRQIDGPGSFKTRGPGGGGSREDIGKFMLVGIEIPAGCWELTARYRGEELSYVVLVEDRP